MVADSSFHSLFSTLPSVSLRSLGSHLRRALSLSIVPLSSLAALLAQPVGALSREAELTSLLPFPPLAAVLPHCPGEVDTDTQDWLFCVLAVLAFLHSGGEPSRVDLVISKAPITSLQIAALPGLLRSISHFLSFDAVVPSRDWPAH